VSELTGKQRRHLRALGQRLAATLHVGHDGVTEAVVRQADAQLEAHELIKVRVSENAPDSRHDVADQLAQRTHAEVAQVLGRTALLYRPRKQEPG
jgi:RNA-binding protein